MTEKITVKEGLKCCKVSMAKKTYMEKCRECPYYGISNWTNDCVSELASQALELLEKEDESS